jgi:hypothetical protein
MNFILFFIFGRMSFTEKNLIETPVMISLKLNCLRGHTYGKTKRRLDGKDTELSIPMEHSFLKRLFKEPYF